MFAVVVGAGWFCLLPIVLDHSPSMSSLVITLEEDVIDKPLQPVGNYILVKMFAAVSRTAGGIVLPDEVGCAYAR